MKLVVCVVRDVRADVYGNPFFLQSTGQAIRQFSDAVNDAKEDNVMYKHPEDFELYQLGHFEPQTCQFFLSERIQIADGTTVASRPKSPAQLSMVQ